LYLEKGDDVPERTYVEGTLGVYDMQRVGLLRDVFLWAYERSCRRHMVIRDTTAEPDPVRLRHREALIAIVAELVRGQQRPGEVAVRRVAASLVPAEDLDVVVPLAINDLRNRTTPRGQHLRCSVNSQSLGQT
jgi:hypothetical protein